MVVNPYATDPIIRVAKGRKYDWKTKKEGNSDRKKDNLNTQTCKACSGYGHCITNNESICFAAAKTYLCTKFMENEDNARFLKSNTYRYKQLLKDRSQNKRMTQRLDGIVRQMKDGGEIQTTIDTIINLAKALRCQHHDDKDSDSDDSSTSSSSS